MNPLHLLYRLSAGLASRWRNLWYRALGVRMNGYSWLRRISIPRHWPMIRLDRVSLDDGVTLLVTANKDDAPTRQKLHLRCGVYVNRNTIFDVHERVEVGEKSMIGPHCFITDADHRMAAGESVSVQSFNVRPVLIEEEVWIGAGVCILAGSSLRKGCVIGAGSVVKGEIPAGSIAVGVPARVIGNRHSNV